MKFNRTSKFTFVILASFSVAFIASITRAQTNAVFQQNANGQFLDTDSCGNNHFASNNNLWTQGTSFGTDCNNNSYLADVSNWNTAAYPDGNVNVTIGLSAHLDLSVTVNNLTINAGGQLAYQGRGGGGNPSANLTLNGGTLTNNGTLTSIGPNENTQTYTFGVNTTLTGTGATTFGFHTILAGPGTLTINSSQNVIGGGGVTSNVTLVNHGSFTSDGSTVFSGNNHVTFAAPITNTGTIQTTASGAIDFGPNVTINNAGGTIGANSSDSVYINNGAAITGGTLTGSGDPSRLDFFNINTATLTGVTIANGTKMLVGNGTLTLNGAISHNGQIFVGGSPGSEGHLTVASDTTLSGTGRIIIQNSYNTLGAGSTLTLGSRQELDAGGVISGALNNQGLINGANLSLAGGNFGNSGTIQVSGTNSNGVNIMTFGSYSLPPEVRTFTIDNTGGLIQAIDPTEIHFEGDILVRNGTLATTGGSILRNAGRVTLENVTNNGRFYNLRTCSGTVTLQISGSLTNNGTIDDLHGDVCSGSSVHFLGDGRIDGNGYMSFYYNALIDSSGGGVITNGASHLITAGNGTTIQASLVNNGEISTGGGDPFHLNGSTVTNSGVFSAGQSGVLQQAGNSILTNYNAATQTLTGGTYLAINGGTLNLNIGPITINAATVILSGSSSFAPINSIQQNLGTLAVLGGRSFSTAAPSGTAHADASEVTNLANAGTVKLDENSALNVTGSYSQGSNSRLYIEIGSNGPNPNFHPLNVSGTAALAGTLDVRLVNGFVPAAGQTFPIINAASISGSFTQVHGADITYTASGVIIHPNGAAIPLTLASGVSRKTHQASGIVAGTFDVNLPLVGSPGVECRSGGVGNNHTLIFTFNNDVVSGTATITGGTATLAGSPVFPGNPNINNIPRNIMIVNLTGVADAQKITVTLSGVTDTFGQVLPDTAVSADMLIGDTTGNKLVSSTDVSQTKLQSGQPVTSSNFREDINVNGGINGTDVSTVKLHVGSGVP